MTKEIVLASASPRRKELLSLLGIPFTVKVSGEEEIITQTDPEKVTEELSRQKAGAIVRQLEKPALVIGADTVVALDDRILGKPKDKEDARQMITSLQGRSHAVYTGVTLWDTESGHVETFSVKTVVHVAAMSTDEIEWYISGDESYDKAGGYGIQGEFSKFIAGIEGDYFNVVGLPVHELYKRMTQINFKFGLTESY